MRRREFIGLLGGSIAWPLVARAQQTIRRVAVIMVRTEAAPLGQGQLKAFMQGFEKLGWIELLLLCRAHVDCVVCFHIISIEHCIVQTIAISEPGYPAIRDRSPQSGRPN
jgi:hypothetical protein